MDETLIIFCKLILFIYIILATTVMIKRLEIQKAIQLFFLLHGNKNNKYVSFFYFVTS